MKSSLEFLPLFFNYISTVKCVYLKGNRKHTETNPNHSRANESNEKKIDKYAIELIKVK